MTVPPKVAELLGSKKFWVFVFVSVLIFYGAFTHALSIERAIEIETAAGGAYQIADGIHSGLQQMGLKSNPVLTPADPALAARLADTEKRAG